MLSEEWRELTKDEQSLNNLWDSMRCSHIHVMGSPRREEGSSTKIFLNNVWKFPRFDEKHLSTHPRSSVPHIRIKSHHSKTGESQRENLERQQEKKIYAEGGASVWLAADFSESAGAEGGGMAWSHCRKKPGNQEFCIQQNCSLKVRAQEWGWTGGIHF